MVVGDFPLDGKIVVVTGGGSGINLAFVKLALEANAKVLIADLKLLPEAETLISSSNGHAAFIKCDVSAWQDLEQIPNETTKAFGTGVVADVWIAGAGVFEPRWSSFLYDTETDHYKALQINTEHPIKLTRIAMRSCLAANKPCVVLIVASMAGVTGNYGAALYCASKHALLGFTKSMSQADIDENVKIVCCCPGMVATPMWLSEAVADQAEQYSVSPDIFISAEEVAQAIKELVEQAKYPGGTLLEVSKTSPRGELESKQAVPWSPEAKPWFDKCYAPVREVFGKERGRAGGAA